jgi:hypothetical protein
MAAKDASEAKVLSARRLEGKALASEGEGVSMGMAARSGAGAVWLVAKRRS